MGCVHRYSGVGPYALPTTDGVLGHGEEQDVSGVADSDQLT